MARSLLKSKNFPNTFWGEAVTTAVYLLNRAPTKSVPDKTPYEAFYGRKPNVADLRTFGCVGHVKKAIPHLTKLEDRNTKMVFIGYETSAHSKAYRMYDPVAKKVHISRDVVFEEDKAWAWSSEPAGKDNTSEPFIDEFSTHIDAGVEVPYSGEDGVLDASQDNGQIDKDDSDVDHDPELRDEEVSVSCQNLHLRRQRLRRPRWARQGHRLEARRRTHPRRVSHYGFTISLPSTGTPFL
jgi:hypothetical protein